MAVDSSERIKTIQIETDLYDSVRKYCDEHSIPFLDFIEDALENAKAYEDQVRLLQEVRETLEKIDRERKKSFKNGFLKGFFAAFCAAQGQMGLCVHNTPNEIHKNNYIFKQVKGKQLGLFGPNDTEQEK